MFGLIFGYVKSTVVFTVSVVLGAAGITVSSVLTTEIPYRVVRIVGFGVLLVLGVLFAGLFAVRDFQRETAAVNDTCRVSGEKKRLEKLLRRCRTRGVRCMLNTEYAETLVRLGEFARAEEFASEATKLAKSVQAKAMIQVVYADLTFWRRDMNRFVHHYERAHAFLKKLLTDEKLSAELRLTANLRLGELNAKNLCMLGNFEKAMELIRRTLDEDSVPALTSILLRKALVEITVRAGLPEDSESVGFLLAHPIL